MNIETYEWGQELFDLAVKSDKPLFLYLYALWQEGPQEIKEKLSRDLTVARLIKEKFFLTLINAQERPDIFERYGQGGLASFVFLTPKGAIISGYTSNSLSNLGDFLEQVASIYKATAWGGRFSVIEVKSENQISYEEKRLYFIKYKDPFCSQFRELVLNRFDPVHGGFSQKGGKSDQASILAFCLAKYKNSEDPLLKTILEKSLEAMAEGGPFDFLDGGFFHQSSRDKWQGSSFEKLLQDNLNSASIYFEAAKVLADRRFAQTAQRTIEFINGWLYSFDTGLFYASVSDDESYYKLAARAERLSFREEHKSPKIDETVYVRLNAQAADLYFLIGQGEIALKALNRLLTTFRSPGGLFFHFQKDNKNFYDWFLADQVFLIHCLLNPVLGSSALGADLKPKTVAQDLWRLVMEEFYDRENGGFFDTSTGSVSTSSSLSGLGVEDLSGVERVDRREGLEEWGLLRNRVKLVGENVEAIRILKYLGYEEEARRSLIEIFFSNKTPSLRLASLATLLLES